MKIASDYAHRRHRAVCADLTAKERKHLGGTSRCMLEMALINAFVPIKIVKWEGGAYRLDRESGWGPKL